MARYGVVFRRKLILELKLTILGCGSAAPTLFRANSAQILEIAGKVILIDCGEGTQWQLLKRKISAFKIDIIFISHLHGDHYFGLIGFLNSLSLFGRENELHIYAPKKIEEIIKIQLDYELSFPIRYHYLIENESQVLIDNDVLKIESFPVSHSIPTHGFLFIEKEKRRKLMMDKVNEYEIPKYFRRNLSKGENYIKPNGEIVNNEDVTMAGLPQKKYAYCADTKYDETIVAKIKDCNVIYHETTYLDKHQEKATARFHSTTFEAAKIAKLCNAKKLIIGHFSSRYKELDQFSIEAKTVFENTVLGIEGSVFEIE